MSAHFTVLAECGLTGCSDSDSLGSGGRCEGKRLTLVLDGGGGSEA